MNKIIVFLGLFITFILVSFCVGGYTHDVYEIDITKKLIYNSGVGNEWHIEFICDNQTIGKTHKIAIPIGEEKKVTINTVITEKDKYPDIGRGSFEVAVKEGEEVSTNILIRETRGRNSGAKAKWEVKCNVKYVGKENSNNKINKFFEFIIVIFIYLLYLKKFRYYKL